jgi:hypothetical protein
MKIITKYDIGHVFWVPRVTTKIEDEFITHNGNQYKRQIEFLNIDAKEKRVTKLQIDVNTSGIVTKYGAISTQKYYEIEGLPELARFYQEDELQFSTKEAALNFARWWRETQQCEYYGSKE